MIKKKINSLFVIFLLSYFLSTTLIFSADKDFDPVIDTRKRNLGLVGQSKDSIHIIRTKLIRNIELGNVEKIKIFLNNYKNDLNFIINGLNPFVHAVSTNNFELVKFFLSETNINIDITDEFGNTALIKASEKGYMEMVDYLINNGEDINYQKKQT